MTILAGTEVPDGTCRPGTAGVAARLRGFGLGLNLACRNRLGAASQPTRNAVSGYRQRQPFSPSKSSFPFPTVGTPGG